MVPLDKRQLYLQVMLFQVGPMFAGTSLVAIHGRTSEATIVRNGPGTLVSVSSVHPLQACTLFLPVQSQLDVVSA